MKRNRGIFLGILVVGLLLSGFFVGVPYTQQQTQLIYGNNSGTIRAVAVDSTGQLQTAIPQFTAAAALSDALANPTTTQTGSNLLLWDTVQWLRAQSTDLSTMPTTLTLTARNSLGAQLTEKGSRWSAVSQPAANSQATASIAAEASVRHVVDCIGFSADSAAAITAANVTLNLRDGATGAGTVIWTYSISMPTAAALGIQEIPAHSFCGLNLVGTTNTAMTFEFSAGVTGSIESANISGFNIN